MVIQQGNEKQGVFLTTEICMNYFLQKIPIIYGVNRTALERNHGIAVWSGALLRCLFPELRFYGQFT
jgi:hypothetical protein